VAFGSVWTCSPDPSGAGDEVLRLDPRSGKVLARLPVAKRPDQGHLEAAAGRLWVITDAGLVGIDPATNQPDPPLDLGVAGTELAVDEEMVWVSSVGDGAVVRVDPAARAVVARAAGLDSPRR
jgi:streptogramin lyase